MVLKAAIKGLFQAICPICQSGSEIAASAGGAINPQPPGGILKTDIGSLQDLPGDRL
jgi:hypothetical protein